MALNSKYAIQNMENLKLQTYTNTSLNHTFLQTIII